jgi:hypothetical protein
MRSTKSLWLALFVLTIALGACKKGDEDPFFSLLSRKSRVSGNWEMSGIEGEKRSEYGTETWTKWIKTGDQNTIIILTSNNNTELASTKTYTILDYSMIVNKDGTWSKIIQMNCIEVIENPDLIKTTTYPISQIFSGTWAFMGQTKDAFKNKERIALSLGVYEKLPAKWTSRIVYKDDVTDSNVFVGYNFAYRAGEIENIYEIEMLKSKEMKWLLKSGSFVEQTTLPSGSEIDYTAEYSESETIIWTAK